MIEKLFNLIYKSGPKKGDIRALTILGIIMVLLLVNFTLFHNRILVGAELFAGIAYALLLIFLFAMSSYAVMKALFFVSAELSLVIFLSQSYCAVPNHTPSSDQALGTLLGVALIYISYAFCSSLYKACSTHYKSIEKEKWSIEKLAVIFFYLFFGGFLIWEIYLVMSPVVLNLCIYK